MPIDARIPLGITGPDPNGFTNALAAGMKMRQFQNEADRLARKDEAAEAKTNALRKFWTSDRGPEAIKTLGIEAPDAVSAIEKNTREAENHEAQAKKAKFEWAKANHELLAKGAAIVLANPTRETATMMLDNLEAQGGDMTAAREQLRTSPDPQIANLAKGWGMSAQQIAALERNERNDTKPVWNSYTGKWESPPAPTAPPAGSPGPEPAVAPPGPPAPAGRRPAMVPGESSGYSTDEIRAEIARLDQGGAPSGNFRMTRESLETLLQAQTDLENAQGGPAAPPPAASVDGPATPVGNQPPPVQPTQGPYQTQAQRDYARDQRQDIRDAALDQRHADERAETTRRLDLQDRKFDEQTRKARFNEEVASGQRFSAADASKARQKLIRIEDAKRQIALVRATWEGTKDDKGNVLTKGIKGSLGAGPAAGIYAPGLLYEAGEKFDAAVESLAASKTALLRVPGIGSQSDLEQRLERMDLPSRSTNEGTTEQEIKAYEDLIANWEAGLRAGLAGPPEAPAEAAPEAPAAPTGVEVSTDKEPPLPKPVKVEFDGMPMPGEYAGKRIKAPDGTIYRSNGRQWVRE